MIIPLREGASQEAIHGHETFLSDLPVARNIRLIRNVTAPSLTVYTPEPSAATRTGVILCPGGSFHTLPHWDDPEINGIARRLTEHGLTVFVLRYRLAPTPRTDEEFMRLASASAIMDAVKAQSRVTRDDPFQALRIIRERASTWGLDPERVGMMGFSAGGLLTTCAATGYDAATRPAFAAPIYGTAFDEYTVPTDAPPLFIAFASDDEGIGVVPRCLGLYSAWQTAGHPVEMHVYAQGGHGFAAAPPELPCGTWMDRYLHWLRSLGFLS
ncbi:alpha/beta hydrolase [Streptosporangium sp. CA-115845]|uniref:alpha/beta hydrolase n=1 Tax=Streptosporangium sp. CA-115845 TaxID=3240071 RepID=UPI003D92E3CC